MKQLKFVLAFLASLALGACAPEVVKLSSGTTVEMGTVGNNCDRSASVTEVRGPNGELIHMDLTVGAATCGQMAVAAVGGIGAAVVNGITAASIAGNSGCKTETNPDGTNYGCNNVIVGGATAVSGSESNSNVDVNIGGGAPCGYCGNEYD